MKVSLLGNLGKDPDVREIPSGKVVSFSLATSDNWTDKEGERQERTDHHGRPGQDPLGTRPSRPKVSVEPDRGAAMPLSCGRTRPSGSPPLAPINLARRGSKTAVRCES